MFSCYNARISGTFFLVSNFGRLHCLGELSRAQSLIDDGFDKEVRDKLKELKIIEDPENLSVLDPLNVHLDSTQAVVSPLSPF